MRRKLVIGAIVAAIVVAGIAATTLSSAGAVSPTVGAWGRADGQARAGGARGVAPHIGKPQTLTFKATTLKIRFVDVDGNGKENSGDYVIFTEQLTNREGTQVKGIDTVRCTLNSAGGGRDATMCDGEFIVDGRGEISVYGSAAPWIGVTGGTGQFSNVRGEASVESIDPDSEIIKVYLTP
jgi:hypothetical protein